MDKSEALELLREIYTVIPELGCSPNFVSIDPNQVKITEGLKGFYELRIKVKRKLEWEEIAPILRTHNLDLTEKKGLLVIF
jgi:hypothetical protein